MATEDLPQPQSPLPKKTSEISTPRELKELYAEVVSLRQTLNAVLTHLHSTES